jgi:hypothetical protein
VLLRPVRWTGAPGAAAAVLAGHAVLAGLARPASTAAVLFALAVLGVAVAGLGRVDGVSRLVAGCSLLVGLLAVPPALASALIAADRLDVPAWWVARLTVAAVVVPLVFLVAVRRWSPPLLGYAYAAALVSAALWPVVAVVAARGESIAVYGGVGLLLVAAALLGSPRMGSARVYSGASAGAAAIPGAAMLATGALPALVTVLGRPYAWLGSVWSGAPLGVGLAPDGIRPVPATATWALGLFVLASATATYALTRRITAALAGLWVGGPSVVIVGLVAAEAPWPALPATMLVLGLLALATVAIAPVSAGRATVGTLQGLLYVGAGLAGALPVRWTTIAALGSIVVTAAVVGVVGRTVDWRVAGWVASVGSALTLAAVAGLAADLAVRDAAWLVLAVAVAALALGAALTGRRSAEATAVSAAAHAGAVVAILLTSGWTGYMATLCAVWGVAVGLRAVTPGTSRPGRADLAATGAGWELVAWWLLLADRHVTLVEAYTVPLALVGLLAGFAALRARPDLRSWVSYGPALAAGFLPSLALALSGGTPWRRLLLGLAALLVVVAGSVRRRQAPVVSGGIVLVALALNELSRVWDLLPRWIPLGAGGLLLVGLAVTYERRRRDLARLRAAVGRMT